MTKYACVYFGPEEAGQQREFMLAMNGMGIITISREEIDEQIEAFIREKSGCYNRLVLEGDQIRTFNNIMRTFFKGRDYEILDEPGNKEYAEWLKQNNGE